MEPAQNQEDQKASEKESDKETECLYEHVRQE
jgi:hypothetical protein